MIVDNNLEEIRITSEAVLKAYPTCEFIFAYDGLTARRYASTREINLTLVEIILPGESGYRLIRSLKTIAPQMNIAILTRSMFGVDCGLGEKMGSDDIFIKSTKPGNGIDLYQYLKKIEKNITHV